MKRHKRFWALALTFAMVMSLFAPVAMADNNDEVPEYWIIIGNTVLELGFLSHDDAPAVVNSLVEDQGLGLADIYFSAPGQENRDLNNEDVDEDVINNAKADVTTKISADGTEADYDWPDVDPVDPVEPVELEVIEVSAITTTGVSVTFEELEEDLDGATVEVVDPNDDVHPVEEKDLSEGDTSASFYFVDALDAVMVGTWTVDGVEFLVDAANVLRMNDPANDNVIIRGEGNAYVYAEDSGRNIDVGLDNQGTEDVYVSNFTVRITDANGDEVDNGYYELDGREVDAGTEMFSPQQIGDLDLDACDQYRLRVRSWSVTGNVIAETYFNVTAGIVMLEDDDGDEQYKTYMNVSDALADAGEDYTVTMLDDVEDNVTIDTDGITLDLNGNELDGDVTVAADDVAISGSTITGDLIIDGPYTVTVSNNVTIQGDLVYRDADATVDGSPTIQGDVVHDYETEEVIVSTRTQFYDALEDQEEAIRFDADITVTGTFSDRLDYDDVTINLAGYTLTVVDDIEISTNNVTFQNGTIDLDGEDYVVDIDYRDYDEDFDFVHATLENITLITDTGGSAINIGVTADDDPDTHEADNNRLYLVGTTTLEGGDFNFDIGADVDADSAVLHINGELTTDDDEVITFDSTRDNATRLGGLVKGDDAVISGDVAVQLGDEANDYDFFIDGIIFEADVNLHANDGLRFGNVTFNEVEVSQAATTIHILNGRTINLEEDVTLEQDLTIETADAPGVFALGAGQFGTLQGDVEINSAGAETLELGDGLMVRDLTLNPAGFVAIGDNAAAEVFMDNVTLETDLDIGEGATVNNAQLTLAGNITIAEDITLQIVDNPNNELRVIDGNGHSILGQGTVNANTDAGIPFGYIQNTTIVADLDVNEDITFVGNVITNEVDLNDNDITLFADEEDDETVWTLNEDVELDGALTIGHAGEGDAVVNGNGHTFDAAAVGNTITINTDLTTVTDPGDLDVNNVVFVSEVDVTGANVTRDTVDFDAGVHAATIAVDVTAVDTTFADVRAVDTVDDVDVTNAGRTITVEGDITGALDVNDDPLLTIDDGGLFINEDGVVIEGVNFTGGPDLEVYIDNRVDFNNVFNDGAAIGDYVELQDALGTITLRSGAEVWLDGDNITGDGDFVPAN